MSSSDSLQRRRRLILVAALSAAVLPTACGFRLSSDIQYAFKSLYIDGSGIPKLADDLRFILRNVKDLTLCDSAKDAEVILTLTNFSSSKEILSLSSAGRAREYILKQSVSFTLRDRNDLPWMPAGRIDVDRTFLYDDSERLAREIQEVDIHTEILDDMAHQILRRLQKAQRPSL